MFRALAAARPLCRRAMSRRSTGDAVNLQASARALRIRLTADELSYLRTSLDASADGAVQRAELEAAGRAALETQWQRDVVLRAVEPARTPLDRLGKRAVDALDYFGTARTRAAAL